MDCKGTIIYIGGFEMPDKNAAAHRVLNNAKIFRELGFHVVFCGVDRDITENAKDVSQIDFFDNIPAAYPRSTTEWARQQVDFSHIKRTLELYDNVKYVVAYNMHALPLFKLQRYAKKKNISIIADVTEWYEYRFSLKPQKFIRWLDTNIVMRCLTKRVKGLIAISSYLKNYYQKSVKNVIVVPPLVDVSERIWHPECVEKLNCIEFVYSGVPALNDKKDKIGLIVRCFDKLPEEKKFMFTIIGITERQFLEMNPDLASMLDKLQGKIRFCGRVSHAESISALKRADYTFIIRNHGRKNMAGFPTKFVEAVSVGIGVIANKFSDIDKFFPMNNSILINDSSGEGVVSALKKCINNGVIVKHELTTTFDYRSYVLTFADFFERVNFEG